MSQTPLVVPPVQTPAAQVWPVVQAMPQVPQLAASVCRFLQVPEQLVWPVGQPVQTPAAQVWPVVQATPQVPQLAASVCRFLQTPEHMVWPLTQTQAPALQVWLFAAEQVVVQVPQ